MWRADPVRKRASALAGDGDVFVTAGMVAVPARPGNRACDFVGIDAPVGRRLGEVPRLAIGAGGMGAAFLAPGKALVDAIAIRLVGDDKNTTVGPGR